MIPGHKRGPVRPSRLLQAASLQAAGSHAISYAKVGASCNDQGAQALDQDYVDQLAHCEACCGWPLPGPCHLWWQAVVKAQQPPQACHVRWLSGVALEDSS